MDLSLVIPLFDESESLNELCEWITGVVDTMDIDYEIIFIDDGSRDNSWEVIGQLARRSSQVKGIRFRRNHGKSAALFAGFQQAQGDVVITMDADLQDSPDEIPPLYEMIRSGEYDLVSGWKKKRHDPPSKTIPTKLFNRVTRWFSGIPLHDFNCGLKAYRNQVVKSIDVYGEMHRYIPVLAKWAGFNRIGEKVVMHRPRKYGKTKFGMERFINGFLDLLSISFVGKFGKRPMHLFGSFGTLFIFIGFLILLYLSIEKVVYNIGGIAERPLFYLGILTAIIGSQLFLTGFLAELVVRNSAQRNAYQIDEYVNFHEHPGN